MTNPDTQISNATVNYTYTSTQSPFVSSVSPIVRYYTGNVTLTISGTGFSATAPTVTIGASTSCTVVTKSASTITCTSPTIAQGTNTVYDITVTNPDTQVGIKSQVLTYSMQQAPTVTSISPTYGTPSGGTSVTITGTNYFTSGGTKPTVSIAGVACTGVTFISSTRVSCTTGAGSSGVYGVTVTNPDTQTGTGGSLFTYLGPVTVSSVSPTGGILSGGTTITVTGSGYVTGATVKVGANNCQNIVFNSSNSLTCSTPAGAAVGNVGVTVTNPDAQTNTLASSFLYAYAPEIQYVVPRDNIPTSGGTVVTIYGTNLQNNSSLDISGTACLATSWVSSSMMTCTVPPMTAQATPYDINLSSPDLQAASLKASLKYGSAVTWDTVSKFSGGNYHFGAADGVGLAASLNNVYTMVNDGTNIYFADVGSATIRKYTPSTNTISTIAGKAAGYGCTDGVGTAARFGSPSNTTLSIKYDSGNFLMIFDQGCQKFRKLDLTSLQVTTYTSSSLDLGCIFFEYDATNYYCGSWGNSYIARVSRTNFTSTIIAGQSGNPGSVDGVGTNALLGYWPAQFYLTGTTLYFADNYSSNYGIRTLDTSTLQVTTLACSGSCGGGSGNLLVDNFFATANRPSFDGTNLYFNNSSDHAFPILFNVSTKQESRWNFFTNDVWNRANGAVGTYLGYGAIEGTLIGQKYYFFSDRNNWGASPDSRAGDLWVYDQSVNPAVFTCLAGNCGDLNRSAQGTAAATRFGDNGNQYPSYQGQEGMLSGDSIYYMDSTAQKLIQMSTIDGSTSAIAGGGGDNMAGSGTMQTTGLRQSIFLCSDDKNFYYFLNGAIIKMDRYQGSVSVIGAQFWGAQGHVDGAVGTAKITGNVSDCVSDGSNLSGISKKSKYRVT